MLRQGLRNWRDGTIESGVRESGLAGSERRGADADGRKGSMGCSVAAVDAKWSPRGNCSMGRFSFSFLGSRW